MEPQSAAAIGGGLIVVANIIVFWIREWVKHKTWSKNGVALEEIKEDVKATNGKVGCIDEKIGKTNIEIAKVKTAVNAQKTQCATTIRRFDKAIGDQNQQIINLTGRNR